MLLGIDYGKANLGLAISEGSLAEPLETIEITNYKLQITNLIGKYNITKIVVGISEGKMAEETRAWGNKVSEMLQLPVEFVDETLSSIEAGESKDKSKDHSKAAAVILQRYLDR